VKRTLGALSLFLLLGGAAQAATFYKKADEALAAAKASNKLIFVDFFAEWCTWCHRFDREIVPSEVFQNATKDMILLRVDTEDRGEGTAFARKYNISRLPTFVVLTPQSSIAAIIQGYAPAPDFVQRMNGELARFRKLQADLKDEKSKTPQQRLEIASELTARFEYGSAIPRLQKLAGSGPAGVKEEASYVLGYAQWAAGKPDEALASLNKFLAANAKGDPVERGWLLRAEIYRQQKNLPAALADYKKFQRTFPTSSHLQTANFWVSQLEAVVAAQTSGKK
jgi:tetratricopeptide (TPR) repeat protein